MFSRYTAFAAFVLAATSFSGAAHAATIVSTVGMAPSGCSTSTGCPGGTDVSGTLTGGFINSADLSWLHSFGAITDTILSATLTIDIIDADNGYLDVFVDDVNGASVGQFDPAGNNSGGTPGPWRVPGDPDDPVMTVSLSSSLFTELMDGFITFYGDNHSLGIWGANSAVLTIETDGGTPTVPVPATLPLLLGGLGSLAALRLRRKKPAV